MSVIEFDRERAIVIFRDLAARWQHCEPPFNTDKFVSPERKYHPKGVVQGSIEHAHFLFFGGWLNRNGKTATELFRDARKIAEQSPWIIDPRDERSMERERFDLLERVIPFASHEKYTGRVDWWYRDCMGLLRDKYDGDPRNIFLTAELTGDWRSDRELLLSRLKAFFGTGPKIAQLIMLFFQEVDWLDNHQHRWDKVRRVPSIAADMWVMRLMRQLNIVVSWESDISTKISSEISDFICEICYEEDIPHTHLIQALWHNGAVICGRMRPKDQTAARPFCHSVCPLSKTCSGIVPANYVSNGRLSMYATKNGKQRTTQRLASLRYAEMKSHPITFDDLWHDPD